MFARQTHLLPIFRFRMIWLLVTTLACIIAAAWFLTRRKGVSLFPQIPFVSANSMLLGFTKWNDEKFMLKLMEREGPLVQCFSYGYHLLIINDPILAKKALKDIHGKGFFHNPNPHVIGSNTFNVDTGPEWSKRRNMFRKAFSTLCLRYHVSSVSSVVSKITEYLSLAAKEHLPVKIDDVLQQLTIEVICKMAFEMDLNHTESGDLRKTFQSIFEVFLRWY